MQKRNENALRNELKVERPGGDVPFDFPLHGIVRVPGGIKTRVDVSKK